MIKILLVTHGQLGKSLLETAGMISGSVSEIRAIGFYPGQGVEDLEENVRATLADMEPNNGVLCFVDIPGGSPARVVTGMIAEKELLQVVSGVNLAMLVETIMTRESMNIFQLAKHAKEAARESILDIGEIFRNEFAKEIQSI